jgi:hypothetical protein
VRANNKALRAAVAPEYLHLAPAMKAGSVAENVEVFVMVAVVVVEVGTIISQA